MEENKNIKEAQIVEEVSDASINTDLNINFSSSKETTILSIKEGDVHKLARVLYNICIDNKIDVTIKTINN